MRSARCSRSTGSSTTSSHTRSASRSGEAMRAISRAGLALMATLALAGPAGAHAFLDHADPKVGSTVRAPGRLQLWFTQSLVTAFCQVTVSGPAGFAGADPAHPAPGDGRSLVVDFKGRPPAGVYTVRWR